ncbi:hypothetical protein NECAME_15728 [Necator americanus]|uniref:Uncharacterized protein n=1 Tax=Necator americanus TaxID=51031 RepID=W2SGE5_NECAM|nr:hypothetical protein NECAME_15728 [Necator americanus]ETN68618.1 hypothetical protein NECAME_15728 [Necator americanus]
MIRSSDTVQENHHNGGSAFEIDHRLREDFHTETSVGRVNEHCDQILCSGEEGELLADIVDVADEVEVLKTSDFLRSRPQLFVGTGQSISARECSSLQWGDPGDFPGSSTGSQTVPGMKSLFKMYGEVAVRKAAHADLLRCDYEMTEGGEDSISASYPGAEHVLEVPLDDESGNSDFFALDPGQIYSKRKQLIHKHQRWPLYWDRPIDFQEASYILTGAVPVQGSKVCNSIPQGFRGEGTFVVNCENLHRTYCNHDGLGSWGRPTGRNRYYGNSSNGVFTRMDDGRGNLLPQAKYIWKCMMRRYEHPVTVNVNGGQNRFIKKIYSALYPPERKEVISFIVITYEWIGEPFDFRVIPIPVKNRRDGPPVPHPPPGSKDWQAASFQGGAMAALPATCSAYFGDCPLYAVGAIDFNAAASIILGGTVVEPSKICNRVPQGYRDCGTFVIDLCNFVTDAELRRDDNGCWGKPAGNSRYYKIDSDTGDAVRVDRGCKLIEGAEYDVQILSKRYEHPSVNGRFVRKIYTGRSPAKSRIYEACMMLAVMTYYWKGEPEYFEAGPQRRVRVPEGAERERPMNSIYSTQPMQSLSSGDFFYLRGYFIVFQPYPNFIISYRNSPPLKRFRRDMDEGASSESTHTVMYRTEYELQERQARLLDRFEAFMDRMERISMCLPQIQESDQQVWLTEASHGDEVAHEEEIMLEDGIYNEEYVSNIS